MAVALGEETEGIDEAGVDERLEFRALFVGEPGVLAVGLRVGQIQFGVRDIEIATDNDRLFLLQLFEVSAEGGFPLLGPVVETREFALGIRGVDIDEVKFLVFEGDNTPLAVVLLDPDAVGGASRFVCGEGGGAGIAGFLRGVPMRREARRPGHLGDLLGFRFDFLQAEHIGLFGGPKFEEAFAEDRAEAVDVPGDEFHELGEWDL